LPFPSLFSTMSTAFSWSTRPNVTTNCPPNVDHYFHPRLHFHPRHFLNRSFPGLSAFVDTSSSSVSSRSDSLRAQEDVGDIFGRCTDHLGPVSRRSITFSLHLLLSHSPSPSLARLPRLYPLGPLGPPSWCTA
jgi:hypothetical protein